MNVYRRLQRFEQFMSLQLTWDKTRVIRDPYVELDDDQFRRRYRMTRSAFDRLLSIIEPELMAKRKKDKRRKISARTMLLIALRFYAHGPYQDGIGEGFRVDQGTVSKIVSEVSDIIASKCSEFIKMPTREEAEFYKDYVKRKRSFPETIGYMDCTHVPCWVPNAVQHKYVNRKGFTSLNCQFIIGPTMKIHHVNARWPGSAHDARIFRSSSAYQYLKEAKLDGHILADSAYFLCPFVLPAFKKTRTEQELKFQTAHTKARSTIER